MSHDPETVGDRLQLALELFDFGVEMMAAKLRRDHPDLSPAQIAERIEGWLGERPGAEAGDGPGVPVALDRFR